MGRKYDIKDMVKDNKKVCFSYYRKGYLYYRTECDFEFPVPINDTGDASFLVKDKALLFMRYIKAHIKQIQINKENKQC